MDSPPDIGDEAIVVSRLTPSGHVRVAGHLMPAVLRGGHAERGEVVEVIEVRQAAVVVERPRDRAAAGDALGVRRSSAVPPLEFPLSPVERLNWPTYGLVLSLLGMFVAVAVGKFPWSVHMLSIPAAGLMTGLACGWLMKGPRALALPRMDHRPAAVRTAILLVSLHIAALAVALVVATSPVQVAAALLAATIVSTLLVVFGVVA